MSGGRVWVGMAVLWAAYSAMFTGYAWLRGYNITLLQVVSPVNYYKDKWPPELFTGVGVLPTGAGPGGTGLGQAVGGALNQIPGLNAPAGAGAVPGPIFGTQVT